MRGPHLDPANRWNGFTNVTCHRKDCACSKKKWNGEQQDVSLYILWYIIVYAMHCGLPRTARARTQKPDQTADSCHCNMLTCTRRKHSRARASESVGQMQAWWPPHPAGLWNAQGIHAYFHDFNFKKNFIISLRVISFLLIFNVRTKQESVYLLELFNWDLFKRRGNFFILFTFAFHLGRQQNGYLSRMLIWLLRPEPGIADVRMTAVNFC